MLYLNLGNFFKLSLFLIFKSPLILAALPTTPLCQTPLEQVVVEDKQRSIKSNALPPIPAEIQAKRDRADEEAARITAGHTFYLIRTLNHDSRVLEVRFVTTLIMTRPDSNYEVKYWLQQKDSEKFISMAADQVEWLKPSSEFSTLDIFVTGAFKAFYKLEDASEVARIFLKRFRSLITPSNWKTQFKTKTITIETDEGVEKLHLTTLAETLEKMDQHMLRWGLKQPEKTHVYIVVDPYAQYDGHNSYEYTTRDASGKGVQYIVFKVAQAAEKLSSEHIKNLARKMRIQAYLKLNYNHDELVFKRRQSFIAKDPTLSQALTHFILAHNRGNPILSGIAVDVRSGSFFGGQPITVTHMDSLGGERNSLIISRLLWKLREHVGSENIELLMPKLLWNLAALRYEFEGGELLYRSKKHGKPDPNHYNYIRTGKTIKESNGIQYEIDNLKFFLAALYFTIQSIDKFPNPTEFLMAECKEMGFVFDVDDFKQKILQKGAIRRISENLVPSISNKDAIRYPQLPKFE